MTRSLLLALAATLLLATVVAPQPARAGQPASPIADLVDKGRYGSAVFRCDRAEQAAKDTGAGLDPDIQKLCAKANLKLGDKLARVRSFREAMRRWRKAAKLDPSLASDAAYKRRLETGLPPGSVATRPPVAPKTSKRTPRRTPPKRSVRAKKPEFPEGEKGPRAGRIIGLGFTGGWDGIFGFVLGWMHAERVSVEVATDLFFRTLDTRIKVYGLKEVLTPFIGVGMLTPFGPRAKNPSGGQRVLPRFDLDFPRYGNLFAVGQMIHVDVGLSLAVWKMEITAGASFFTSFNQDDPNRLLFFPQFGAQLLFYFP